MGCKNSKGEDFFRGSPWTIGKYETIRLSMCVKLIK